jgi:glycosyltransferase involved in cell wall biosynthesis
LRLAYSSSYDTGSNPLEIGDLVRRFAEGVVGIAEAQMFDVIHAHDWATMPAAIAVRAAWGKPAVMHFHSTERDRSPGFASSEVCAIEQEGLSTADWVVAVSEYERQRIADSYVVDLSRLSVIHNGVEEVHVTTAPPSMQEAPRGRVLFVGRLTAQKGPQYFLLAAVKVLDVLPETRFLVVGEGDMHDHLRDMACELGIRDKLLLTGFLSKFDLDRVYAMSDVCVMTSVAEPFGMVALEAMSRGIPTVVPREAGVAEAVQNCIRIDYWDADMVAGVILEVLENRDGIADRLARDGAAEARRLTWDLAARRVRQIYETLMMEGPGRGRASLG